MVELYIKELVMDDKDKDDYSITIGPTDQCSTITIGSASDTASNGLIFSNTMSDVTYSFDTSDMSGATVGGISSGPSYTFDTGSTLFPDVGLNTLDEDEITEMCKEYPALKIVWQNFKTMYDLVKQDYKGKKLAGELDDDLLI